MSFNSNIHSKRFTSDILPQSQTLLQSNFATVRIKTPSPLQSISYKQAHKLTRSQLFLNPWNGVSMAWAWRCDWAQHRVSKTKKLVSRVCVVSCSLSVTSLSLKHHAFDKTACFFQNWLKVITRPRKITFPPHIFYTTVQSFGIRNIYFFRDVSYAHQGCIYLIKNTIKTVKYYFNLKPLFWIRFFFKYLFL